MRPERAQATIRRRTVTLYSTVVSRRSYRPTASPSRPRRLILVASGLALSLAAGPTTPTAARATAQASQAPQASDAATFQQQAAHVRALIDDGRYADAEARALDLLSAAEARQADDLPVAEAIDLLLEIRGRSDGAHAPLTLEYGRRAIAIKEARLGRDALGVAATLTWLATVARLTNDAAEARTMSERALAIRERQLGPDAPDVARTLTELGAARLALQDRDGAMTTLERALAIIERENADAPADARRRDADLSLVTYRLGIATNIRANIAQRWHERAIAADERSLPPGHPDRYRAIHGLASALADQDNIPAAAEQYARAVALLDNSVGRDHPMLVIPLANLCRMRTTLGDYVSALRTCDRAFDIVTRRFGPDHPRTAGVLDAQFRLRMLLGDQPGALDRLERSRTLLERQTPVDALKLVTTFNNLALAHEQLGDDAAALAESTRALAELARIGESDASWLVPPLTNQARLFAKLGRLAEAAATLARARALAEPAGSWMQVFAVQADAYVAQWQGDAAASLPGYRRAIDLWEALSGPDDVRALAPRTWYASALAQTGDFAAARREVEVIDARGLANLRLTARGLEEHQALEYARQMLTGRNLALTMLAHERRPAQTVVTAAFDALVRSRAVVLDEMAARQRAVVQADRQADVQARRHTLIAARERLARLVMNRARDGSVDAHEARVHEARDARDAAERALAEVSTAFREEQAQEQARAADVAAALPSRSALLAFVRYTPSPLQAGPIDPDPDDAYGVFVLSAAPAAGASASAAAPAAPVAAVTPAATGAGIGAGTRATAVAAASSPDAAATSTTRPATARLAASAERSQADARGRLTFIALGSAREIDARVASWRATIDAAIASGGVAPQRTEAAYREAGDALRARIWDPVRAALGDAARVFIVPDAALHLVDFQVLPVGTGRAYLVEQGPALHYLLAERDLLRPAPARRNLNFLALGNPDFTRTESVDWQTAARRRTPSPTASAASASAAPAGAASASASPVGSSTASGVSVASVGETSGTPIAAGATETPGAAGESQTATAPQPEQAFERRVSRSACDILSGQSFAPLPGAHSETTRIFEMWNRVSPHHQRSDRLEDYALPATGAAALLLTEAQATEAAFKTLAPGQGILHVATHGFFLDEHCRGDRPAAAPVPSRTAARNVSRSTQFSDESPLLRAGLVLAGANRRSDALVNDDDGMLTAEEIAGLDLSATEWAVLSACDTGRGDWQAGEGVMGLRRAFQIAGARTVIMSLWAVDDAVSARWMTTLYEQRFLRRASTVEAVRAAHRALLADRRAHGRSTHPIYWAGFIAAGDWR